MNREIKFRAWDKINQYMFFTHQHKGLEYIEFPCEGNIIVGEGDGDQRHENIPLMQYTGLKDKNGVEVYEGDVVYLAGYGNYICEYPFIELHDAVAEKDIGDILGNIYQNPELLNK